MAYPPLEMLVDAALVVLSLALIYLLQTRGYFNSLFSPYSVEASAESVSGDDRAEYVKRVRQRRKEELDSARRDRKKCEHLRDEAKKQLMKREIDDATYRALLMDAHKGMIEADARIKELEGD